MNNQLTTLLFYFNDMPTNQIFESQANSFDQMTVSKTFGTKFCKFFKVIKITVYVLCISLLNACVKDKPNPEQTIIPNATHRGILISNEGSYGNNNAELSFLDLDTRSIFNQLYNSANKKALGDIVQSVSSINGKYYIVINNSNRIEIIDLNSYQHVASIASINSPRYITQVSQDKAYVSCLYSNLIYVINLQDNSIIKTIHVDFNSTEKMQLFNGYCYVTNWDTASHIIYQINTLSDSIESKIQIIGAASHDIVLDQENRLWILSGNKYKKTNSYLTKYDPITKQIIQTFSFQSNQDPFRLILNAHKDTLYFVDVDYNGASVSNGLFKMSIHANALPMNTFIKAPTNSYFWAVGFDSITSHIFLSDPKGFTQQSTIYEYTNDGNLINQYTAGIGSNGFLFK